MREMMGCRTLPSGIRVSTESAFCTQIPPEAGTGGIYTAKPLNLHWNSQIRRYPRSFPRNTERKMHEIVQSFGYRRRLAMNVWEFLILLLVAAICGAVAQAIAGFSRGGFLVAIAVGFIGALFGTWIQRVTGAPEIFVVQ